MKQRFYEEDSTVSQAVKLMMLFPADMQSVIANSLSEIAENECKARELMNDFRSMGSDKILSLHKSKKKARDYDENPATHKAMNYMMILSPEQRLFIARKIIELSGYIQDYLKTCKQYDQEISVNQVEGLSNTYVNLGPEHTKHFIALFKGELEKKAALTTPLPDMAVGKEGDAKSLDGKGGRSEAIQAQEGVGMRIKGDRIP